MALSALAPSEKSVHLIYAMLPVTLSIYLVLLLGLSDDARIWVAFVTVFAPVLTVLLYESGIDEFAVNEIARRYVMKQWYNPLKTDLNRFREKMDLNEQELVDSTPKVAIQNSLHSYPIRRSFWRIRASIFLIPTSFFLVSIPFVFEVKTEEQTTRPLLELLLRNTQFINNSFIVISILLIIWAILEFISGEKRHLRWFVLLMGGICLSIGFLGYFFLNAEAPGVLFWQFLIAIEAGIFAVNFIRHRKIFSNIVLVSEFVYMFDLFAIDAIKRPKDYIPPDRQDPEHSMWKFHTKSQLEYLDSKLIRGEWSIFAQSWNRIKSELLGNKFEKQEQ